MIKAKSEENQRLIAERDELTRRLRELTEVNRRLPEYEQRMVMLQQDNEKLQVNLKSKVEELNSMGERHRLSQQETDKLAREMTLLEQTWMSKHETEIRSRSNSYEQNMANISRERDELKRFRADLESKVALLGQELERVNRLLANKN